MVTVLRSGAQGLDAFNAVAPECTQATEVCPSHQLAIVVDGRVLSTPEITTERYESAQLRITGFDSEVAARALAERLSA